MAVTKIHPIKSTVVRSIAYICNKNKTDGQILISSFACAPETAEYDFKFSLSRSNSKSNTVAYHIIQSFAPGEVDFDSAHLIGEELAERHLKGRYSYVIATHIDHAHVHNHIIFCAADNLDGHRYNDCKNTYRNLRKTSDELCLEHGLSVIEKQQASRLSKCYKEWLEDSHGNSWKSELRKDIRSCTKLAFDFNHFMQLLRDRNWEVKVTDSEKYSTKKIYFRRSGSATTSYWIKGHRRSLGSNYTYEKIFAAISEKQTIIDNTAITREKRSLKSLLSLTSDSAALKKWETRENLKRASEAYLRMNELGISSLAELESTINSLKQDCSDLHAEIRDFDHTIARTAELYKYVSQYYSTKAIHDSYEGAKNKDAFYRKYESQLMMFDSAANMLKRSGINLDTVVPEKLLDDLNAAKGNREKLTQHLYGERKKVKELSSIRQIMKAYLREEDAQNSYVAKDVKGPECK